MHKMLRKRASYAALANPRVKIRMPNVITKDRGTLRIFTAA